MERRLAGTERQFQARDKNIEKLQNRELVLEIRGPLSRQAEVDTIHCPLWYVIVENTQPGSVSKNVSVRMNNPRPEIIMSFHVDLHRMHDNDKPFKKRHDIRYGEKITFDLLACGQAEAYPNRASGKCLKMRQDGVAIAIYGHNPPGVIDFILTEPVRRPQLHGQPAAAPLAARLGTH